MKKVLFLVGLVLIAGGCSNNQFEDSYNKMQVSDDNINGYTLDLRIFGSVGDERINQVVKINSYNNKDYKITKGNTDASLNENMELNPDPYLDESMRMNPDININENRELDELNREQQGDIIYVIGGKTFVLDKDNKYTETDKPVKYNNPAIYLNGLKDVTETSEPVEKIIEDKTYNLYNVTFTKTVIEPIIKDTGIENIRLENDVKGEIYLNADGYVYRIIYYIDDLTINANYYGINTASQITLPVVEEPINEELMNRDLNNIEN
ncbi:MAG: hypothetical protein PHT75_04660 [Bacilli bacterium]|nr:hypothetical protein [Bacilli bacterium]MDD3305383.1 hypothetical protein [Bacilli bacterium]MDD4054046.1 hypothetical protein [Bacilli bacterium]MDD4411822.1 hypothetical protein [Bacilli bacterium]